MKKLCVYKKLLLLLLVIAVSASPALAQIGEGKEPIEPKPTVTPAPTPVIIRPWKQPLPVEEQIKDAEVISVLTKQGIDYTYVEKVDTKPYSESYYDRDSGKTVTIFSSLPILDGKGDKIEVGFTYDGSKYTAKNNLFSLVVTGTQATLTNLYDQPSGIQAGDSVTWNPVLTVGGVIYNAKSVKLLLVDPYNSNYSNNVVDWDYGICHRYLRIIEGILREWWVFTTDPKGDIVIDHKQTGKIRLGIGTAFDAKGKSLNASNLLNQIEVVKAEELVTAVYPVTVSATYNFTSASDVTVDGYVYTLWGSGASWNTIRAATSNLYKDDTTTGLTVMLSSHATDSNEWDILRRGIVCFNTASLPDNCIIQSATLSLYGYQKANGFATSPSINVYSANPSSTSSLATSDYSTLGTTDYATDITYAAFSTVGYNDFTLNDTGEAAISKTGVSKFGLRLSWDADNSPPAWIAGNKDAYFNLYTEEQGAGFIPKLVVVVAIEPTIDTLAATGVGSTSATLWGNITAIDIGNITTRGFVWDTTSHDEPEVIPSASDYAFSYTEACNMASGNFSYGDATFNVGTKYYYRAYGYSSDGLLDYGDEVEFTTSTIAPDVSTGNATYVGATSARLQGTLNEDGGATTTCYFYWGTADGGNVTGAWGHEENLGTKSEGGFYLDISSLPISTTHYFTTKAVNDSGTDWGNQTKSFTTLSACEEPTSLIAIPKTDELSVSLSWVKGLGGTTVHIMYKVTGYPTNTTDGSVVYTGTGTSWVHEGLVAGKTYYYSAWGLSGNLTSTEYATAMATTSAGASSTDTNDPNMPTNWYQSPNYTALSALEPFYTMGNEFADSINMPYATWWLMAWMTLSMLLALGLLVVAKSFTLSAAVLGMMIIMGVTVELLPLWFLLPVGVGTLGTIAMYRT